MRAPTKRELMVLALSVVVFCSLASLHGFGFFDLPDRRLTDRLIPPRKAESDIVIVAIDDQSITSFGVWPWPRAFHADMIDLLSEAGAKEIRYDVTFSETSNQEDDERLANAIVKSGIVFLATEKNAPILPSLSPKGTFAAELITDADGVVRRAVENGNAVRIPFIGPPGSFPTYRFTDIAMKKNPSSATSPQELKSLFKDKIVFVGATAHDLHDSAVTASSHGQEMAGVEIQANILQAEKEDRSLKELPKNSVILLLLALGAAVTLLSLFLKLRYLFFSIAGLGIAYLLVVVALSATGFLLPVIAPILLILVLGGTDVASRYFSEKSRRQFIHHAFAHYLAPQVIEKLIRGEAKLELGGVKRELTILFSDIRGFTSLSEKMKPEELVPFLNEYLSTMTDVVLGSEGTVDKYIGDAIMAFWGAPITQHDHAIRSAATAVSMKRELAKLQKKWSEEGKPSMEIGVGINTGEVLVGNMGSRQRFDYTVIGDDVNLASRLEGLTKQYGVTIICSEATKQQLKGSFHLRELDLVAVKGRKQPVRIYELMETVDNGKDTLAIVTAFEKALQCYRAQDWDGAQALFEQLAKNDKPSQVFLERVAYLRDHSPGKDWDGSFTAKEK